MNSKNQRLHYLIIPIYFQNLVLFIVLFSDTLFLSTISDDVVAGVGSTLPLVYSFVSIIGTFASIGISFLSRGLGEKNIKKVISIFKANLIIGVCVGAILASIQSYIADKFGIWINLTVHAFEASFLYLLYMSPMLFFDGIFLNLNSYLLAKGMNKITLISSIFFALTNIFLNTLLFYKVLPGLTLGPKEIAISTVISQFFAILVMIFYISKDLNIEKNFFFRIDKEIFVNIKSIIYIAIPALIEPLINNLVQVFLVSILSDINTLAVAAYTYCSNIILPFTNASAKAVAIGSQTIISYLQGQSKYELSKNKLIYIIFIFFPISFFLMLIINILSYYFVGFFTCSQEVLGYCKLIFFFMLLIEPLRGINWIIFPLLRGSADIKVPILVLIISQLFFTISLGYFLGIYLNFGLVGIFTGILIDEGFRAIFNILRWKSMKWVTFLENLSTIKNMR